MQDAVVEKRKRLDLTVYQASQQGLVPANAISSPKPSNGISSLGFPGEMQLSHHFATVTSRTLPLCPEPRALNLWTFAVPQVASEQEHEHLRYAVLAVAALHYRYLRPGDGSMLNRASYFCGKALRALGKKMKELSSSNAEPLVMTSLLISLLSSRFTTILSDSTNFAPATEYFRVAKGTSALLKETDGWIHDSPIRGYLDIGSEHSAPVSARTSSFVSDRSTVDEDPLKPLDVSQRGLVFIHQCGPALDYHSSMKVRSRVMVDYRSSKRKDTVEKSTSAHSASAEFLDDERTSRAPSSNDTISKELFQVVSPQDDPTFSYLLRGISCAHPHYNAYDTYLALLNSTLLAIHNNEPKTFIRRRMSSMPAKTPAEFVILVEKGDERALVMMMHHYALLKLIDDTWWLQGIAEYNFKGLRKMVGRKWDWALEETGGIDST